MTNLLQLLCVHFCLLLVFQHCIAREKVDPILEETLFVHGTSVIGRTDNDYVCATLDWWPPTKCDYGLCSWGNASLLNLDLTNNNLSNAIRAFSPLKIRLGGTLQDKVIYHTDNQGKCSHFVKNETKMFGFSEGCLSLTRWDELNAFFKRTGAKVVFGLNALNGRKILQDGSLSGSWNSTNAALLIEYTFSKHYEIHGWELGNELSGHGVGTSVGPAEYARNIIQLNSIVQRIYNTSEVKPLVIAPGGFFEEEWFKNFINTTTTDSLDVVTHHIYNLGPGVDEHLVEKILNPDYLRGMTSTFNNLRDILNHSRNSAVAWVGEAGGAYNSGRRNVSNAFVYSFWYLDQLGMAAMYDTRTYCRQTLVGGNYGLLDLNDFSPNPDYYSALLWHRLMGTKVLSTKLSGAKKLRAYAHCSKQSAGITVLLINFSRKTLSLNITLQPSNNLKQRSDLHHGSLKLYNAIGSTKENSKSGATRHEYHLTAGNGGLLSRKMQLNGEVLALTSGGEIPALNPKMVNRIHPVIIGPHSIVFVAMDYVNVPECHQD